MVGVVAGFPKASNKEFVEKLKEQTRSQQPNPPRVEFMCTFGDPSAVKRWETQLGGNKPSLQIYLDGPSCSMFSASFPVPSVAIVSSRSAIECTTDSIACSATRCASTGAASEAGVSTVSLARLTLPWILETTPDAGSVARQVAVLKPAPAGIGLACIKGDAAHEAYVKELVQSLAKDMGASIHLTVCHLPGASCNNADAIAEMVKRDFAVLPDRSLLLILPGNNTLKFPFVFDQYASQRQFGLVGLGDFHGSTPLIHIGCPTEEAVRVCTEILSGKDDGALTAPKVVPISYAAAIDSRQLKQLGYEAGPASLKPAGSSPVPAK